VCPFCKNSQILASTTILVLCILLAPNWGQAGSLSEARNLNKQVLQLINDGHYQEALPLAERALQIAESALPPENSEIASFLNNLGFIYKNLGAPEKAISLDQRALKINEKAFGPAHLKTANALGSLALSYSIMGMYDQALPLAQRALQLTEKLSLYKYEPAIALRLNNLANVYGVLESYDKAIPLAKRAVQISEQASGPNHPDTAIYLNQLAVLHQGIGAFEEALSSNQRVLKIREKVLGPDHPSTALSLNNLAVVYYKMGFFDVALPLYQRALQIREKALGPTNPITVNSLQNLGLLYLDRKDYAQAEAYFRKCQYQSGLVELYLTTGRASMALDLLAKMIPTPKQSPTYHIQYFTQQGEALTQAGRRREAALALVKAVKETEQLRQRITGERIGLFRAGISGGFIRPYQGLVKVLAEMAEQKEPLPSNLQDYGPDAKAGAFYFTEATKGRALLEGQAEAARKQILVGIPEGLRQREESLVNQITALDAVWEKAVQGGEWALREGQQRKERLAAELQILIRELRQRYPLYAALHYPQPYLPRTFPSRNRRFSWSTP